jgi:hypothetical protein
LILPREGNGDLAVFEWPLNCWLDCEDFSKKELLGSLGEARVSSKYDVDDVLLLLETVMVFLIVFVIFVLFFLWSDCRCRLEGFVQDCALPHRVVVLGTDWASFVVEDLVELILRLSPFLPCGVRSIVL